MSATNGIVDHLRALGPNAVVYSDSAWAAARKSAVPDRDDWFPDPGAWGKRSPITSAEMVEWTAQWEVLRNG